MSLSNAIFLTFMSILMLFIFLFKKLISTVGNAKIFFCRRNSYEISDFRNATTITEDGNTKIPSEFSQLFLNCWNELSIFLYLKSNFHYVCLIRKLIKTTLLKSLSTKFNVNCLIYFCPAVKIHSKNRSFIVQAE